MIRTYVRYSHGRRNSSRQAAGERICRRRHAPAPSDRTTRVRVAGVRARGRTRGGMASGWVREHRGVATGAVQSHARERTRSVRLARSWSRCRSRPRRSRRGRSPASTSKSSRGRRGRSSLRSKPRWCRWRRTRTRSPCVRSCSRSPTPSTAMAARPAANEQFERREVYLSTTLDGMGALNGTLDPEATEFLSTAFDVVIEMTRHEGDPRSRPPTTRRRTHRTREGRPRQLRQGAGSAHPTAHLARRRRGDPVPDRPDRSRPRDPRRRRTHRAALGGHDRTVCVRRRHHPHPHQGPLRTPRRRPRNPRDLARAVEGARRARPRLRRTRL